MCLHCSSEDKADDFRAADCRLYRLLTKPIKNNARFAVIIFLTVLFVVTTTIIPMGFSHSLQIKVIFCLFFSSIKDPESQRKRTVQNVLDLRQNLEETMTSLRGAQLSHR